MSQPATVQFKWEPDLRKISDVKLANNFIVSLSSDYVVVTFGCSFFGNSDASTIVSSVAMSLESAKNLMNTLFFILASAQELKANSN